MYRLRLEARRTWLGPGSSGAEIFCYSFLFILTIAGLGAFLDVVIVGTIVDRIKNSQHKRA